MASFWRLSSTAALRMYGKHEYEDDPIAMEQAWSASEVKWSLCKSTARGSRRAIAPIPKDNRYWIVLYTALDSFVEYMLEMPGFVWKRQVSGRKAELSARSFQGWDAGGIGRLGCA
jgi:hypothetical protein